MVRSNSLSSLPSSVRSRELKLKKTPPSVFKGSHYPPSSSRGGLSPLGMENYSGSSSYASSFRGVERNARWFAPPYRYPVNSLRLEPMRPMTSYAGVA